MTRDELEAALSEHFDADHLSVYGDYLQSLGDPRGELIALDLGEVDGARELRDRLLREWLGDELTSLIATSTIEHGFLTDLYLDGDDARSERLLDVVLAGPAASYIRGVTIRGDAAWIATAVTQLSSGPHTWLNRLSVQIAESRVVAPAPAEGDPAPAEGDSAPAEGDSAPVEGDSAPVVAYQERPPPAEPIIDGELARMLTLAMPKLEQLEVWGHRVFGELAHDALRSLCMTGWDAVGSLLGTGAALLPGVVILDLAFHTDADSGPHGPASLDLLLPAKRLPALRRLDLSRNEPGNAPPHYLGGRIDTFAFFERLALRNQLTHVRMPSVRSRAQAARLASATSGMPALREILIARSYLTLAGVTLPPFVKQAPAFPWWPADQTEPMITAVLETPQTHLLDDPQLRHDLAMPAIVVWLEHTFGGLPDDARTAWHELFEFLRWQQRSFHLPFPREVFQRAIDSVDSDDADLASWLTLRSALQATPKAALLLYRYPA